MSIEVFNRTPKTIDGVDIFIKQENIDNYISESYYILSRHYQYLCQVNNLFSIDSIERKEYFNLLHNAFSHNLKILKEIMNSLENQIKLDSFANTSTNSNNKTSEVLLKDYHYIQRDWCSPHKKSQIDSVVDAIRTELNNVSIAKENALFLGAGTGRFVFEIADIFDKSYATDKSFSMVWHTKKLMEGREIDFYKPILKNVLNLNKVAKKFSAYIPSKYRKLNDKVSYFVSDVLDLPLNENSLSVVFSIYFTDVIALKLWFNKINLLVQPKGLFVHFGPLDSFFTDPNEMLTAEEFKSFFESNGYKTITDTVIETPHIEDSNSMSYKVYRNWFFIAQKNEIEELQINDNTVLSIKKPLSYERKGVIKEGEKETEVNLELPKGTFNGASSVVQILKLVDGQNTFNEIIEQLKMNGFAINNSDEIKNLLLDFLSQGILSIED